MAVSDEYKYNTLPAAADDLTASESPLITDSLERRDAAVTDGTRIGDSAETRAETSNIPAAAAAAGGVVGLLVGGPILGLVAGIGAGYAVTTEGPSGDIARAAGDVAINVGESARQINEKHHVTDKVQESIKVIVDKACEANEKHRIVSRVSRFFRFLGEKFVEFEGRSHIVENILKAIASGATVLVEKLKKTSAPVSSDCKSNATN
jgi:hypothetical protein